MEPWIWQRMIWSVGFLCVTYVPLQLYAVWKRPGMSKVAAALPLIFMVPVIIGGCSPDAYRDGSLYGMYFICPYLPAMIYLGGMLVDPRQPHVCPHCGHQPRVVSFRRARTSGPCEKCGKELSPSPLASPPPQA